MKATNLAVLLAAGAAAFVGYKAYSKVAGTITGAADGVKKIAAAAVDVLKTDLNPASDQNLAYRGVNSVAAAVTNDPSFNLGNKLWELTHSEQVAKEKGLTTPVQAAANVQAQAAVIAQSDFRKSEIKAQDAAEAASVSDETRQANAKSNFRLSEIAQEDGQERPGYEVFLTKLQGALYGA